MNGWKKIDEELRAGCSGQRDHARVQMNEVRGGERRSSEERKKRSSAGGAWDNDRDNHGSRAQDAPCEQRLTDRLGMREGMIFFAVIAVTVLLLLGSVGAVMGSKRRSASARNMNEKAHEQTAAEKPEAEKPGAEKAEKEYLTKRLENKKSKLEGKAEGDETYVALKGAIDDSEYSSDKFDSIRQAIDRYEKPVEPDLQKKAPSTVKRELEITSLADVLTRKNDLNNMKDLDEKTIDNICIKANEKIMNGGVLKELNQLKDLQRDEINALETIKDALNEKSASVDLTKQERKLLWNLNRINFKTLGTEKDTVGKLNGQPAASSFSGSPKSRFSQPITRKEKEDVARMIEKEPSELKDLLDATTGVPRKTRTKVEGELQKIEDPSISPKNKKKIIAGIIGLLIAAGLAGLLLALLDKDKKKPKKPTPIGSKPSTIRPPVVTGPPVVGGDGNSSRPVPRPVKPVFNEILDTGDTPGYLLEAVGGLGVASESERQAQRDAQMRMSGGAPSEQISAMQASDDAQNADGSVQAAGSPVRAESGIDSQAATRADYTGLGAEDQMTRDANQVADVQEQRMAGTDEIAIDSSELAPVDAGQGAVIRHGLPRVSWAQE